MTGLTRLGLPRPFAMDADLTVVSTTVAPAFSQRCHHRRTAADAIAAATTVAAAVAATAAAAAPCTTFARSGHWIQGSGKGVPFLT